MEPEPLTDFDKGKSAYNEQPWLAEILNPYTQGTVEYEQFESGWMDAEFDDKVENGYFDWI